MLKIINEVHEWDEYLNRFSNKVFWCIQYYQLYSHEGFPEAAIYEDHRGIIFYPYLRRRIHFEQTGLERKDADYFDLTTAYGFGGPLIRCVYSREEEAFFADFRCEFELYCKNTHVVSEFIRFQPFVSNSEFIEKYIDVDIKTPSVYVELLSNLTDEDYLKTYQSTNRNRIKKAKSQGLQIMIDEEKAHLKDFIDIYYHTMERNGADAYYYFHEHYFTQLIHHLEDKCLLVHVIYEEKIICSELILYDESCMYSFLGGTLADYYHLSPNNLLTHEIILWAKNKGSHYYLLGGGYKPNDGIYKFKKKFAPNNSVDFFVGKKIINQPIYDELSTQVLRQNPLINKDYFPLYRAK